MENRSTLHSIEMLCVIFADCKTLTFNEKTKISVQFFDKNTL